MKKDDIGVRVRDLREAREMTSTELGRQIGISQAQISRLEAGKQGWRSRTLQKVADALGVTVGFLYSDKGSVAGMASLVTQNPALKKVLQSPELSELALKLAQLKRGNVAGYRAVKTLITQLGC